jgi:hypothetical protein
MNPPGPVRQSSLGALGVGERTLATEAKTHGTALVPHWRLHQRSAGRNIAAGQLRPERGLDAAGGPCARAEAPRESGTYPGH